MIPVHVLTGFLGSGKTTLLRRALRDPALQRTAVIMNELGDIGLDHHLIETSDESFVRLTTGCICCRVRSDLTETLLDLAARVTTGEIPPFEQVVLETTGLADPAPILQTLLSDTDLRTRYRLGRVITTVDAALGLGTLERYVEARRQVAFAETVVLTKTDRPDARAASVRDRIASMNRRVELVTAIRGDVPNVFEIAGTPERESLSVYAPREGSHTAGVTSFSITRETPLHAATLALFLSALAQNCGASLLRVKGLAAVAERPDRPAVIQGVQHVYAEPEWLDGWPTGERATRLVFIGGGIPVRWVRNLLELLEQEVLAEAARQTVAAAATPQR